MLYPTALALLLLLACAFGDALRLGKPAPSSGLSSTSTHRFPEDLLARPAFRVQVDSSQTISNETVQGLVGRGGGGGGGGEGHGGHGGHDVVGVGAGGDAADADSPAPPPPPMMVMHSSPSVSHLCTLAQPSSLAKRVEASTSSASSPRRLTPANLLAERHRIIRSGLHLLSPLRGKCLYHTSDWFTYSVCFGEAIRQFRAIPNTVGSGKVPAQDSTQHAFVLGRWRDDLDVVGGHYYDDDNSDGDGDGDSPETLSASLGITPQEAAGSTALTSTSPQRLADLLDMQDDDNGTELMEIIDFRNSPRGDDEGEEAGAGLDAAADFVDDDDAVQRYLSQHWSDGTLCDINNEPRSVEVQYHCNTALTASQITLIKETTTCHYVLVIETDLICKEPRLGGGAGGASNGHGAAGRRRGGGGDGGRGRGGRREASRVGQWKCTRIVDGSRGEGKVEGGRGEVEGEAGEVGGKTGEEEEKTTASESEEQTQPQGGEADDAHDAGAGAASGSGTDADPGAEPESAPEFAPLDDDSADDILPPHLGQYYALGLDDNGQVVVQDLDADEAEAVVNGEDDALSGLFAADADDAADGPIEFRLDGDDVRRLLDGDRGDMDARLQRLHSRLSSITDALVQARGDGGGGAVGDDSDGVDDGNANGNGNGDDNANDRDGSASIFAELNRAARGQGEDVNAGAGADADADAGNDASPRPPPLTLRQRIMQQLEAQRQERARRNGGEGGSAGGVDNHDVPPAEVENTPQGAVVDGYVRGPSLGGAGRNSEAVKRKPTFHGGGRDKDPAGSPPRLDTFADRAQRFYDDQQKRLERESEKKKQQQQKGGSDGEQRGTRRTVDEL